MILMTSLSFSMDEKNKRIWNLLLKEEKTIKSLGRLDTGLRYRLLEIESEKLRIIRDRENERVLKTGKRTKGYYKETRARAVRIQKMAKAIISKNPYFVHIPDIYYTLGMNSRDLGKHKQSAFYLNKALKLSKGKGALLYKIHVALGEYYYNNKKFKRAIWHYKYVINNMADEWTTKNYYNYAWCLLLNKNIHEGIDALMKTYELSVDRRYIDVSSQVLDSAASFFVKGHRIEEALNFYKKNAPKESEYFIKLAKKTNTSIGVKKANEVYTFAINHFQDIGEINERINVEMDQVSYHLETKEYASFESLSEKLIKEQKILTQDQKKELTELLTQRAGYLQTVISKNGIYEYKPSDLISINKLFSLLREVNPTLTHKYYFLEGETHYGLKMYKEALKRYTNSLKATKKAKIEEKFKKDLYTSLLASINEGQFKKKEKNHYLIYAYTNFLLDFPAKKESPLIYKDLFRIYLEKKSFKKADKIITIYNKNLKKDLKVQRELFKNLLNQLLKEKNVSLLTTHVNRIRSGHLSFDQKYLNKVTMALGHLLFSQYDLLATSGKFQDAEKGYTKVYSSKVLPNVLKGISAHNLSILNMKRDRSLDAWNWHFQASKLLGPKEINEREENFALLVQSFFDRENFNLSEKMASWYFSKFCLSKKKIKNDVYSTLLISQHFNSKNKDIKNHLTKGSFCRIKAKTIKDGLFFIARNTFLFNKEKLLKLTLMSGKKYRDIFSPFIEDLASHYENTYDFDKALSYSTLLSEKSIQRIFSKKQKSERLKNLENELKKFQLRDWGSKKFEEVAFNNWLEYNMHTLEKNMTKYDSFLGTLNASQALRFNQTYDLVFKNEAKKLTNLTLKGLSPKEEAMVKRELIKIQAQILSRLEAKTKKIYQSYKKSNPLDYNNFSSSKLREVVEFQRFPHFSHHLAGAIDQGWLNIIKGDKK